MAHWCESCGQTMPEGEASDGATWLGLPKQDHNHSHDHPLAKPAGAAKTGRDKKLLLGAAALLAAWALFVGLGQILTPDAAIDEQAAAEFEERVEREAAQAQADEEAEQAAQQVPEVDEVDLADVPGDYGAADAAPGFADADLVDPDAPSNDDRAEPVVDASNLGARVSVSVQVERLQRQLARRESTVVVAYQSDEGVVILDMQRGTATVSADVDEAVSTAAPGDQLLRSEATTYAVDPTSMTVRRVGEGSSLAVSNALDGNTYFVGANSLTGQAAVIEVVSEGEYGSHRMPTGGLQLNPVDGLGLLAVSKGPIGQTLIAGADSFSLLSENRVITGTNQALLEQRCESATTCSLVIVQLGSGEETMVPPSFVRFGDQYSLSPNGQLLLRYSTGGFAEVFVLAGSTLSSSGSIAWVIGAGMRSPAWGPNSDFIVWLDQIGDPELKVMFTDERDWLSLDLRDVGAPAPSSPELIAFTPTLAEPTG